LPAAATLAGVTALSADAETEEHAGTDLAYDATAAGSA